MRETLLFPVVALAVVAALLVAQVFYLVGESRAEARSDHAIADANKTQRLAIDAETGERGYLIGGNPVFLQPYDKSTREIKGTFHQFVQDAAQNPVQAQRVQAIQASYALWLDEAKTEMRMMQHGGDYRTYFNQHRSKDLMDDLRGEFGQFIATEDALHDQRKNAAEWALRTTIGLTLISALGVALLLAAFSRRQMHALSSDYDEALASEVEARESFAATLLGIGDAVLVTDAAGRVTLLNAVAERLTGWTSNEASGQDSQAIFPIFNETTHAEVVSPIQRVIASGAIVGLANHTVLRRRDGTLIPIDDSGAPIRSAQGKLIGVVLVFRDVSERRASERELTQSLRREHTLAVTLQRSLLQAPPPDRFSGIALGSVYEPAHIAGDSETMEVGGDFLDAFALSDDRVALVVGDVSGKGLVAAARTAEVLYTLRGLLRESNAPGEAVTRLNRILCDSQALGSDTEGFTCLCVAVLDASRRTATVCAAGAEPPLIARADGQAEELSLRAMPLSVIGEAQYGVLEVALGPGDTLVMVTDGITEARLGSELFGYPRLMEAACAARAGSPSALAEAILRDAKHFSSGPLRDDACILTARFL